MRLADWRKAEGLKQSELADRIGVTQASISYLERARCRPQIPSHELMVRIYRLSKGAVAPNDFYDLPDLDTLELALEVPGAAPLLDSAPLPMVDA